MFMFSFVYVYVNFRYSTLAPPRDRDTISEVPRIEIQVQFNSVVIVIYLFIRNIYINIPK